MDFGQLLSATWRVAWRHKYLWVLGLFAISLDGCASFPSGSFQFGSGDFDGTDGGSVGGYPFDEPWFWLAVAGLVFIVGLVLFVISLISTAGLIAGADDAYRGEAGRGLRRAWSEGVSRFWALLGLLLFVGLIGFLVFVALALAFGIPIVLLVVEGEAPPAGVIVGLVLAGLFIGFLLLVLGLLAQIVLSWSYRSLVIHRTGVFASLGAGWRLFRGNVGTSILVWAIAFGLNIAFGLVIGVALIGLVVPVALAFGFLGDPGAEFWPLLAGGALIAVLLGLAVKAFGTTFFTSYWTIAYRRLSETGGAPGVAASATLGPSDAPEPPTAPAAAPEQRAAEPHTGQATAPEGPKG